ncbi:MAG: hypothetical protein WDO73_09660 [Ignavibacteriota bacterium]
MKRAMLGTILASCALSLAFAQSSDAPPKLKLPTIRVSGKSQNPFMRTVPVHRGRWEIKYATMVDLIHLAYNFDNDKVLGGSKLAGDGSLRCNCQDPARLYSGLREN